MVTSNFTGTSAALLPSRHRPAVWKVPTSSAIPLVAVALENAVRDCFGFYVTNHRLKGKRG